jgi:hypothetical protein
MLGHHPWAWGCRRNEWSLGEGDAPACAGGWRRTRHLDGVHLGGRGHCRTKPSPSFCKSSGLQSWRRRHPSPDLTTEDDESRKGAWFQESITTPESQKIKAHDAVRYAGVRRQGAEFSRHQFDALADWEKNQRKLRLGICTRWKHYVL